MYFQGKLDAKMLYRSYSLLTFIRGNASTIYTDQLFELKIGLAKRHASVYITPKFGARLKLVATKDFQRVHNTKSINNIDNLQWISLATLRAASSDTKVPGDTGLAAETKDPKVQLQQKIIELDSENLENIKERVLNVGPPETDNKSKDADGKKTKSIDKSKAEASIEAKSVEAKNGKTFFLYSKIKFHKFRAKL